MKPKSWDTTKIGSKIKIPKSKNMRGIKSRSKSSEQKIKKLRISQRKKILEIKKTLKDIEQHVIAISGLESLKASSVERIQNRRQISTLSIIRLVSELAVLNRKISKLETAYKKSYS